MPISRVSPVRASRVRISRVRISREQAGQLRAACHAAPPARPADRAGRSQAAASLDAPSEAALFASYRDAARNAGGETITVLVTHRFGTVHMADQVIVMDDGQVVESGDHQQLIDARGMYAELFALQAAGYQ